MFNWFFKWREERAISSLNKNTEGKFRRWFRFYQIGFFTLLAILGFTIYFNYDYWVFKLLIANNYVFTDVLDEFYSQHILEENRRSFHRDFDRVVISVVTDALSSINNDRYTYLYSPQRLQDSRERDVAAGRRVSMETLTDDTVLLFLPNISRHTREFVQSNRVALNQYNNLVLDLRGNYGGMLSEFRRIAELFTPQGVTISHEETRFFLFDRTLTTRRNVFFDFENIIILQNRRTASAAESLILALKEHGIGNVVTVGERTFGKGIGQVTIPLTGGYAVRATVLNVLGPTGESINIVGIYPDVWAIEGLDMIDHALEIIAEN